MAEPLLSVRGISKHYRRAANSLPAVDGVTFDIFHGETLALCGPSGSGKSTIARIIAHLLEPDTGRIDVSGEDWAALSGSGLRKRRRDLQMVFQDPNASMNPRATVGSSIAEPLRIHHIVPASQRRQEVARLMQRVGLDVNLQDRRRHELSGGQRQRVSIARAIACRPKLIILDEATSALDTTVRRSILELLIGLQRELGIAYLLISHDIALVRSFAHRVAILDHGRIVELGDAASVIDDPMSDVGRALTAATPRLLETAP